MQASLKLQNSPDFNLQVSPQFYTMVNVGKVKSSLAKYIKQNCMRLQNSEFKFDYFSLQIQHVQATQNLIMDKLGVRHNPQPVKPPSSP